MASSAVANQTKRTILELMRKYLPESKPQQLTVDNLDVKSENALHPLFLKIRYGGNQWILEDYVMPQGLSSNLADGNKKVIKDIRRKGKSDVLQASK